MAQRYIFKRYLKLIQQHWWISVFHAECCFSMQNYRRKLIGPSTAIVRVYALIFLLMLENLALITEETPQILCFTAGLPHMRWLFTGKTSRLLILLLWVIYYVFYRNMIIQCYLMWKCRHQSGGLSGLYWALYGHTVRYITTFITYMNVLYLWKSCVE